MLNSPNPLQGNNATAIVESGTVVAGAVANGVLYVDAAGLLANEAAFTYDESTNFLTVGNVAHGDGSVGAPSMSFTSDPDSGFYIIGANNIGLSLGGTKVFDIGQYTMAFTPQATTGTVAHWTYTGPADTALTASTESIGVNWDLSATRQYATGALATHRSFVIQGSTVGFVGASTLTKAVTFSVTAAPAAGTNATLTSSFAAQFGGTVNLGATSAGMLYSAIDIPAHTVTVTGTTQVTSAGLAGMRIGTVTVTDSSAVTIDSAASLYIADAVAQAGSVTITNKYALWVDSGNSRFDGQIIGSNGSGAAPAIIFDTTATTGLGTGFYFGGVSGGVGQIAVSLNGAVRCQFQAATHYGLNLGTSSAIMCGTGYSQEQAFITRAGTSGGWNIGSNGASSSGVTPILVLTGADNTGQTASTEINALNFNLNNTRQWATGALTTQREFLVQSPTYAFVGASTVTTAVTFSVTASPAAGTNATFTSAFAAQFGGAVTLGATSAGLIYGAIDIPAHTVTVTGSTQVTSAGPAGLRIGIVTVTDASAVTIDTAASLYIAGAIAQAGSVTITNKYALWVNAGVSRFDGNLSFATADATDIVLGTSTGTKIGTATAQKLAFHNSAPVIQRAGAAQAAVATTGATNTTPYGYTTAAQADAIVTLVNELRAALVEKGLIKGAA